VLPPLPIQASRPDWEELRTGFEGSIVLQGYSEKGHSGKRTSAKVSRYELARGLEGVETRGEGAVGGREEMERGCEPRRPWVKPTILLGGPRQAT
jgi:hypothetical protein